MEKRPLTPEVVQDEQAITMAAFMGALDDIAEATITPEGVAPDEEIAERVMGLFDTASTFYNEDMARNVELVQGMAARLGEMACSGHNHLAGTAEAVNEKFGIEASHDVHDHDSELSDTNDGEDDDDEDGHNGKKKGRKWRTARWSFSFSAH